MFSSYGGPFRLKFTYRQTKVDVLPLTLIGRKLMCNISDDILLISKESVKYRSNPVKSCSLYFNTVIENKEHCQYECRCFFTDPCEIYIFVIQPTDKILCDVIITGSTDYVK